jgi:hypothetical protein
MLHSTLAVLTAWGGIALFLVTFTTFAGSVRSVFESSFESWWASLLYFLYAVAIASASIGGMIAGVWIAMHALGAF